MADQEFLARARESLRMGDHAAALEIVHAALVECSASPQKVQAAGRVVRRALTAGSPAHLAVRVRLVGQCTTTWLADTLAAVCWVHGIAAEIEESGYDQVIQDLSCIDPALAPNVVVLLPWHQRLLAFGDRGPADRVADELALWSAAWRIVTDRAVAHIVQVGYDWVTPGALGYHLGQHDDGHIGIVRQVNLALRNALPTGAYWVALDDVSGTVGRTDFYDPRSDHWTHQPFSERGLVCLAEHLCAGIRAVVWGPKKVLVLDLDNTLWGGVIGEDGVGGIKLGDDPQGRAFRAFQQHVKALSATGVLLAVCSKNDLKDAQSPFRSHAEMVLQLEDFACFVASWESKVDGLRQISRELNLGLDSFVFFDDNPAERDVVRKLLPQVDVVAVPDDPSEYVRALQAGLWFERARQSTPEDRSRTRLYAADRERSDAATGAASLDEHLSTLQMRGDVRQINDADMARVVQLLARTNQFNLTTRRHSAAQVAQLLAQPDSIGLSLRLMDRFGDHGLVAAIIAVPMVGAVEPTLRVDSFLMSCRVIGRTVEHFLLNELVARAARSGFLHLLGEYRATTKNALVANLYANFNFTRVDSSIPDLEHAVLRVDPDLRLATYVHPIERTG